MKKQMKRISLLICVILTVCALSSCDSGKSGEVRLDPKNPVSLTIWHYYNGAQQAAFDALVSEFNDTVGREKGIYVEGYSQGSVSDLEAAITASAEGKVGSSPLPDIFSTYADTAYAIQKSGKLADLNRYFTAEEQAEYVDAYISEGHFGQDDGLYLFPVAKSTEILMLNKTDWQPFADATGSVLAELSSIEGVVEVAQRYYEWTDAQTPDIPNDGHAFYGRDSMPNYMIISMRQLGVEIFDVENEKVTLHADKDKIRRLWDCYYVPYIKGYFVSLGRFRSDDVKTGDILAYTGSSSSSMYFPNSVMTEDASYDIDFEILPIPVMAGGEYVNVQQGASMAAASSDEQHEYAAVVFLKWFTQKENNLRFVCESSYLPVKKEANTVEALDSVISTYQLNVSPKAYACLSGIISQFEQTSFYTPRCFDNGYKTRQVLGSSIESIAAADRAAIDEAIAMGADREETLAPYLTDEYFDAWYTGFCATLTAIAEGSGK